MGCFPLAVTTHFDQGFPNNARLQRHLADRNAIWRYFVSMRLYLAMLFILSITSLDEEAKISKKSKNVYPKFQNTAFLTADVQIIRWHSDKKWLLVLALLNWKLILG